MPDVYTFINSGLLEFSDNGIYDKELREHCIKLNELLNKVTDQDYNAHIKRNEREIHKEIERVNISMNEVLFVDLSKIVSLLHDFQRDDQFVERDHYYHSIQCFLLAIVFFKRFYPNQQIPDDITAILFSLTMYHDIGYLYKTKKPHEDQINESFANFFTCKDHFHESDMVETLCLRNELYNSSDLIDKIILSIKNSKTISDIWSSSNLYLLENDTGLPHSLEYKNSHGYFSALILYKTLYTKNIINDDCAKTLKIGVNKKKSEWFKKIIKAVFYHDCDSLPVLLDISNDFYTVYLMIIDELQTYGREFPPNTNKNTNHPLINPKDVGFHWDTANPKKLVIDMITSDKTLKRKYSAHSCIKIKSKLRKKINKRSLAKIK